MALEPTVQALQYLMVFVFCRISVGARLGLEGVMIWAGGKWGKKPVSSSDSLHTFRLRFFNPHKSFIPVRK